MRTVRLPCAVCGGRRLEPRLTVPNLDFAAAAVIPEIAIAVCGDCGLIMQNPCAPEPVMARLYRGFEDKVSTGHAGSVTENESRGRLKAVMALKPPPARLLEVGCSDGTFLALADDAGYDVVGIEPSAASVRKVRSRFPDLEVRRAFLEQYDPGIRFDIVCHFFVLEHAYDPGGFLSRVRELLRHGGATLFELPNAALYPKLGYAHNVFNHQHICHFSPSTLAGLLARRAMRLLALNGRLGACSKAYGMRVAAAPAENPRKQRAANSRAESLRLLKACLRRRDAARDKVRRRVGLWLKGLAGQPGPIVIFGAGENGRVLLSAGLAESGRELFFCDSDKTRQGGRVDGVPVLAPESVPRLKPALVIAASIDYEADMVRGLRDLGVPLSRIARLYGRGPAGAVRALNTRRPK